MVIASFHILQRKVIVILLDVLISALRASARDIIRAWCLSYSSFVWWLSWLLLCAGCPTIHWQVFICWLAHWLVGFHDCAYSEAPPKCSLHLLFCPSSLWCLYPTYPSLVFLAFQTYLKLFLWYSTVPSVPHAMLPFLPLSPCCHENLVCLPLYFFG